MRKIDRDIAVRERKGAGSVDKKFKYLQAMVEITRDGVVEAARLWDAGTNDDNGPDLMEAVQDHRDAEQALVRFIREESRDTSEL